MSNRPGGTLAHRPLHFFWITDCSGSMGVDGKIQAMNNAIRECIPPMREAAQHNPSAQILVRAVKFSNGAQWHIPTPTLVSDFVWENLTADGETFMGKALEMVADQLKVPPMSDRALPPVLVLITDGQPTDDFNRGLRALNEQPWGVKAVRIAIAIGSDADMEVLQKFLGENSERRPLLATNSEQLVNYIKWTSTAVLNVAASPPAQAPVPESADTGVVAPLPLPMAPSAPESPILPAMPTSAPSSVEDPW